MMWQQGSLGGEFMPEDENPHLEKSSLENYLYFSLPMSLNYQRNSYTLWENAHNLVFTNEIGEPLKQMYIKTKFNAVVSAAGLSSIRFHDLRHPYVKYRTQNFF